MASPSSNDNPREDDWRLRYVDSSGTDQTICYQPYGGGSTNAPLMKNGAEYRHNQGFSFVKIFASEDVLGTVPTKTADFNASEPEIFLERYHNAGTISAVDTTNETVTVPGDETSGVQVDRIDSGDTIEITGSTGNDGTYTVSSVSYDSGNDETTITVSGDLTDGTADGQVLLWVKEFRGYSEDGATDDEKGNTSIHLWGFDRYTALQRLDLSKDNNNDLSDTDSVAVMQNALPTGYTLDFPTKNDIGNITAVDTTNETVTVSGDVTGDLAAGDHIAILTSTGNDGNYSVASTAYNSTNDETTITINEDLTDSTADGFVSSFVRHISNYSVDNKRGVPYAEMVRHIAQAFMFYPTQDGSSNWRVRYEPEGFGGTIDTLEKGVDDDLVFKKWKKADREHVINKVTAIGTDSTGSTIKVTESDSTSITEHGERFKRVTVDYATTKSDLRAVARAHLEPNATEHGMVRVSRYSKPVVNDSFTVKNSDKNVDATFTAARTRRFFPEKAEYLSFEFEQKGTENKTDLDMDTNTERAALHPTSSKGITGQSASTSPAVSGNSASVGPSVSGSSGNTGPDVDGNTDDTGPDVDGNTGDTGPNVSGSSGSAGGSSKVEDAEEQTTGQSISTNTWTRIASINPGSSNTSGIYAAIHLGIDLDEDPLGTAFWNTQDIALHENESNTDYPQSGGLTFWTAHNEVHDTSDNDMWTRDSHSILLFAPINTGNISASPDWEVNYRTRGANVVLRAVTTWWTIDEHSHGDGSYGADLHPHGDGTLDADLHPHSANGTLSADSHGHGQGTYSADNHPHGSGTYNADNHPHNPGTYTADTSEEDKTDR